MKAIRVHRTGGPEVMELEEIAEPRAEAGQVVVRVHAIGVNPVDTYIRAGTYYQPVLPYTPGMDAAGIVESVGSDVTSVAVGDRVYVAGSLSGTYAEKTLCRAGQVHRLADRITFAQGAGVYVPYATAYRALFQKARATPGETLLVHGASGGVGNAAVQLARAAGLVVYGTAGTERGRRAVEESGAHHVLNHNDPGFAPLLLDMTGGRGVAVILEMLANVNLAKDLDLLAPLGRLVVIGSRGSIEIDPRKLMRKDLTVMGMTLMNTPEADASSIHAALGAGLENGTLRPVVGREFPLAEAPKAHVAVMESGALGKIVLIP